MNTDESVTVDGHELYEPSKEVTEAIKEAIETDIALPQKAEGRVEVTEGGGLKFSKGEDLLVGLLDMKLRDIVKFIFTGRLFGDSSKLRLKSASTRGTRAAGDMELVSEAEYEVIEAGDQVVTVKLDELEATVGTISVTETEKTPIARTYTPDKNTRPVPRNPLVDVSQSDALREPIKINKSPDIIDDSSAIEEKLDNLSSLLEKNIKNTVRDDEEIPADEDRRASAAKNQMNDISEENLSFIKLLYNTLIENEVDEIYVNQLTDEVEKITKPGMPFDFALANVYQKMVLKFGKAERTFRRTQREVQAGVPDCHARREIG